MKKKENERLVNRAPGASSTRRIADIFQTYQARLRNFISRRVASREDCEDILQDVFYQLLRTEAGQAPIEQMSAWLYAVARNQIIDRGRKKKEIPFSSIEDDPDESSFVREIAELFPDGALSAEMDYFRALIEKELGEALLELPAGQRAVFELTELEGFSFKEIAASTGLSVNTLLSRKRYAVLALRKRLAALYEEWLSG